MLIYTLKRALLAMLVALTVSMLTFGLLHLSSDPAVALAGEDATEEDIQMIRVNYGFDKPLPVQYLAWLTKALQGDLGTSFYFNIPVSKLLQQRLPVTLTLGACSLVFAILLAVPLGVLAAMRPNTKLDRFCLTLAVSAQAMPAFWFGLMLIVVFCLWFPLLPVSGSDTWQHFVMPTIVVGTNAMPAIMRLTRTGMLDVLATDYIRTARAKGLRPKTVLLKHALRNAVIPVIAVIGVQAGYMMGGSVIIETVFGLNGLGLLAYESIMYFDLACMEAVVLLLCFVFIITTFVADIMNAWLDPRIRIG